MIKLALFDIDGILNVAPRFSTRYTQEFGVSMDTILEFFEGSFQKCLIGKADLREELEEVKDKWNFEGSVDELLNYWFKGEVNEIKEVREFIMGIKQTGVTTAAGTNQEKLRIEYLTKTLKLNEVFEEIYSSARIGIKKPDTKFFEFISEDLSVPYDQIIFWDDKQSNVDSAKSLGIHAYLFEGLDKMKEQFNNLKDG
ncbi:MAG TPA: HAD-IA family hydrolase [Candidatus Dojkabacteria bacterium]|nr:HAD-IA family hydrolase [Candidatus Dojkabacteria bacterium]HRO65249.1 HAD-IA family hydrolase [Candidatus Dojkabacteria bacterium]HRP37035.1 HAD-IA family hydrolase [Candidatus Dojkabacteria bacterium]HRP51345.1 HAD-IA family hydrolase [Candidatus Dojkabacteria bacterium]